MLTDQDLGHLRAALSDLCAERKSCIPISALKSFGRIETSGFQITIDMHAIDVLGAPMIVAQPLPIAVAMLANLSPREREVAMLLARGSSNKTIAAELAISIATVKDHVHRILSKTGVSSRSQIAAMLNLNQRCD